MWKMEARVVPAYGECGMRKPRMGPWDVII